MAEKNREPGEMLDQYIYDYFVKRKLHESAKAFAAEVKVSTEPVEIDAPGGFLYEWWCIVWDMHAARYHQKRTESVAAYLEAKERRAREHQQQIQMQQMQMMQQRNVQLQCRDPINSSLGGQLGAMNSNGMLGQPSAAASVLAMKLYEERMKFPQSMDSNPSSSIIDANKMALLNQSLHGNAVGMSADLRKIECRSQLANVTDIRPEGNLNGTQRPLPMDPSFVYGQALMQSNSGSCVAGSNQGVANMPMKGWPLTEPDRPRPNLGAQLHGHNHVHNLTQSLAQSQAHGSPANTSTYVGTDPHNFGGCPRRGLSANNEQSTRNDASTRSPSLTSSPKMNVVHEQNASSQQPDHPRQQKLQNNNKRRHSSSSGPATITGYGNTTSHSPNSPSSTDTPSNGTTKSPNNPQPANSSRNVTMYQGEGSPGLLSSYDQLEDINVLTDMAFLDVNVESYLITEGEEGKNGCNSQSQMHLKADTSKDMQLPSPNI